MIQRALENGVQIYTNIIMKYAIATLLVLTLITISFLKGALTFEENMTRDIEVYLPEGEESTDILIEVREDWATDIIIVYVETPNARNPDYFSDSVVDNIVDIAFVFLDGDYNLVENNTISNTFPNLQTREGTW